MAVAKARRRGGSPRRQGVRQPTDPGREHWRSDGQPKTRYTTRADADRSSLQLRLEHGADLDPYTCSICGGWHLGNRS